MVQCLATGLQTGVRQLSGSSPQAAPSPDDSCGSASLLSLGMGSMARNDALRQTKRHIGGFCFVMVLTKQRSNVTTRPKQIDLGALLRGAVGAPTSIRLVA